jgi:hypothetical protein
MLLYSPHLNDISFSTQLTAGFDDILQVTLTPLGLPVSLLEGLDLGEW